MDERGFGMASVRFICGTQDLHLELEARVSRFLGTEDTILFSSCFDANGGVFESLFGPEDAIISDALNHASIIDGIRLCKARRYRYANQDMAELEARLQEAADARRRIIVTDGVFSMDGYLAPLEAICDLAERYDALVMVDDSHAVGFMGGTGAGTPEHAGVSDRVDIYTGTFGKALGGASGGYVSGRAEVVAMLRQKARPYLFSNSLAPAIVAATIKALDLVENSADLRSRLFENAALFRRRMTEEGFDLLPGEHAIVPVMFGDAVLAAKVADRMLAARRLRHRLQLPGGSARCRQDPGAALGRAFSGRRRNVRRCVRRQPRRSSRLRALHLPGTGRRDLCKDGGMAAHYDVLIVGGGIAGPVPGVGAGRDTVPWRWWRRSRSWRTTRPPAPPGS